MLKMTKFEKEKAKFFLNNEISQEELSPDNGTKFFRLHKAELNDEKMISSRQRYERMLMIQNK